jgi:nicotinate-nucleotide adenylyltransferase
VTQGRDGGATPRRAGGATQGRDGGATPRRAGSRVGVFGGTFDPIHVGHLVTAVNVRHALQLDRLLLVVANHPWQKADRQLTPAAHRMAMVQAAVADDPGLEASDLELRRGGTSYTADTLAHLAAEGPADELFLVLGGDAAAGLPTWERVEEVRARARLVVVTRPGSEGDGPPPGWECTRVVVPRLEVSSTDLRARFADGRPPDYLIPGPVIDVIRRRHLYAERG